MLLEGRVFWQINSAKKKQGGEGDGEAKEKWMLLSAGLCLFALPFLNNKKKYAQGIK